MSETWNITAKKKLIEKSMTKTELAKALELNYSTVCSVLSGKLINEQYRRAICEYLGIWSR